MQRSSNLGRILLSCVVLLVAGFSSWVLASEAVLEMGGSPVPVRAGDTLSLHLTARNVGAASSGELTLFLPLPAGLNQWTAWVEVEAGAALAYPPNGLISIGVLPPDGTCGVFICADVESTAPGDLWIDADLLGPTGRVAETSLRVNVAPSVDAGPDQIVELGGPISLSGASAADGGTPVASLIWTDGGAGGVFDDERALHPLYTAPSASGLIELTLTATDEDGASSSDSMRLSVNAPPTVDAGEDLEAVEGTSVSLDSSTVADPDGSIVGRTWSDGGAGGRFLPSADALHPTYVVPVFDGCEARIPVTLSLTVTDDRGAQAVDSITVWVENLVHAPAIDAGPDREITGGQTVTLTGEISDEDGDIGSAFWHQVGGPPVDLVAVSLFEARFDAPDVSARTEMHFALSATDACGLTATDSLTIVLIPGVLPDPDLPSDETPSADPEEPVQGTSSLAVRLEMTDDRGLPVNGLASPGIGDRVVLRVAATNTGDTILERLTGSIRGHGPVSFDVPALAPWQTARTEVSLIVENDDARAAWTVDALAYDSYGRIVRATDRASWWSEQADTELRLELSTDPAAGAIDEALTVVYRILHLSGEPVEDLVLIDDRLGRIDLPAERIETGAVLEADAIDRPSAQDLPGTVSRVVTVSGFTADGRRVQAVAGLDTPLDEGIAGGGGSVGTQARVVISEIAWAGNPDDRSAEWIELANLGPAPVDLDGWTVCWIDADRASSPIDGWTKVDLTGSIEPIEAGASGSAGPIFEAASAGVWRVLDGGTDESSHAGPVPGYYLLERGSDDAVANFPADCVYGDAGDRWDLPDRGAVVLLLDAQGRLVDSANAAAGPWPAGLRRTGATMERADLLRDDSADAWRTNPGLLAYGCSSRGTRLWASAGHPSGPNLEQLIQRAKTSLPALPLTETMRVPVALPTSEPMPWLQLAVLPETGATSAGGGGSAAPMPRLTTERDGADLAVTLDPEQLPAGLCFVWITGDEGEARLLLVRVVP